MSICDGMTFIPQPHLSRSFSIDSLTHAADFAKMGKTAMKVTWAPISDKAATIREAADQAVVAEAQAPKNGRFIAAEAVPGVTPGRSHTDP